MIVSVGFQSSGDGARISCEALADWFTRIFALAWIGFLFLISGLLTVLMLGGTITPTPGVPLFVVLLLPIGMIVLAVLFPWLGYRSAGRHAAFIADFVRTLLGANDGAPTAGVAKLEKAHDSVT